MWLFYVQLFTLLPIKLGAEQLKYASSALVRNNVRPNFKPWKHTNTVSKIQCAAFCLGTAVCKSFYFGNGECGLFETQHAPDDNRLVKTFGYNYYKIHKTDDVETGTDANEAETTLSLGTTTQGPKRLVYYKDTISFENAYEACKERHGSLVSIHDEGKWQQVVKVIKAHGTAYGFTWIGLNGTVHVTKTRFDLVWTDGTTQNENTAFNHWGTTDPDCTEGKSCVLVALSKWNDGGCDTMTASYICEEPY